MSATIRFLISCDVCSLFTIIPLKETIDIAVNWLFEHRLKITKAEFEFETCGTHFHFQGTFYDQMDRLAMRFPFGLVLANIFMSSYEVLWLNTF